MSDLMVLIRLALKDKPLENFEYTGDTLLSKAQAKRLFGVTDSMLRGLKDHGPLDRSKSSYKFSSVYNAKCRHCYGNANELLGHRYKLEELKKANPDLVAEASAAAITALKARLLAEQKTVADAEAALEEVQKKALATVTAAQQTLSSTQAVLNIVQALDAAEPVA
mmetsp:Transcript_26691/g.44611  ORF Transcript_26691/g.44611 Transcript_26691/m.44611 type:complete len:166 (+) Transcript_26691:404-901(+)